MAVPWKYLLQFTPQIIDLSRELLKRSRGTPPPPETTVQVRDPTDLSQRIDALEDNERRQAELVERMATQQAELSAAVVTLHRRQKRLIGVVVILAVVVLVLVVADFNRP